MRAIFCTARGPAAEVLALQEATPSNPGPGEVLVALKASGVNPSDVKLRSGAQGPMVAEAVVVHNDGAGVIEAVGEGVDPARVGQRVWLYNVNRNADGRGQGVIGTAAEQVCVPEAQAPMLPEPASFPQGACLGVPAMTAHRAVTWAGSVSGKTVLVTGGAGAVGHSAIQIAKAKGARVIATVSGEAKAKIAAAAGADEVINYRSEDLAERLEALAGADGVNHVVEVDLAAHIALYPRVLALNATVGAYASSSDVAPAFPFYPLAFKNIAVQPVFVYSMSLKAREDSIRDIGTLLAAGALTPLVARRFELADAAAAHEAVESGALMGNAVLTI